MKKGSVVLVKDRWCVHAGGGAHHRIMRCRCIQLAVAYHGAGTSRPPSSSFSTTFVEKSRFFTDPQREFSPPRRSLLAGRCPLRAQATPTVPLKSTAVVAVPKHARGDAPDDDRRSSWSTPRSSADGCDPTAALTTRLTTPPRDAEFVSSRRRDVAVHGTRFCRPYRNHRPTEVGIAAENAAMKGLHQGGWPFSAAQASSEAMVAVFANADLAARDDDDAGAVGPSTRRSAAVAALSASDAQLARQRLLHAVQRNRLKLSHAARERLTAEEPPSSFRRGPPSPMRCRACFNVFTSSPPLPGAPNTGGEHLPASHICHWRKRHSEPSASAQDPRRMQSSRRGVAAASTSVPQATGMPGCPHCGSRKTDVLQTWVHHRLHSGT